MANQTRVVVYGENRLNIDDASLTVKEIQNSMSDIFPELKNATATEVGNEIHFEVKAGTKGMANGQVRVVVYGENRLNIDDASLTVKEIQNSMSDIFPELKNATATEVGNEIHFEVKAGTKGATGTRVVVYGENRLNIDDASLTVKEIQNSMSDIFPELKNATATEVGNEIHFEVKAGTKGNGTRVVVYGENRLNIDDASLTVKEIQNSMSDIFPELKNATATEVGNEIHFEVKAGTKGAISSLASFNAAIKFIG
jgi:uncharacterized protein (UPF0333 family)